MSDAIANKRIGRRTIAKGAAWTVPVVAVAAPVAVAATSGPIVPSYRRETMCKHSNKNQAHAVFCFKNTTNEPIVVTLGNFDWNGVLAQAYFSSGGMSTTLTIPANTETCSYVDSAENAFPDNTNTHLTLYFSYPGSGTLSVTTEPDKTMENCASHEGAPKDNPPHDWP